MQGHRMLRQAGLQLGTPEGQRRQPGAPGGVRAPGAILELRHGDNALQQLRSHDFLEHGSYRCLAGGEQFWSPLEPRV